MSTKRMFYRLFMSELIFLGLCILLFVAHLAFWLDDIGIAERVLNIYLTSSLVPIYILLTIYSLVILTFTVQLYKQLRALQKSNYSNSRRAFILILAGHFLAFSFSSIFVFVQDPNSMATVIPSLFSLYFAIMFLLRVALIFKLFVRRNNGIVEV